MITFRKILEAVEQETDLKLASKSREINLVFARAIFYKLCVELMEAEYPEIADFIKKDRNTVRHSYERFDYTIKNSLHWYAVYLKAKRNFTHLSKAEYESLESEEIQSLKQKLKNSENRFKNLKNWEKLEDIITLITKIPEEDLREFKDHRLIPFLKIRKAI